jgi:hypothetical protein
MAMPLYGWSASGDLVTGSGVSGSQSYVGMQASLPREDSLTVQFNVQGINPVCRAEITASVQGNRVKRLLSVSDGASITLRGKNIDVRVKDFTSTGGPFPVAGTKYQVSILGTLGVRAASKQPPLLDPLVYRTTVGGANIVIDGPILVLAGSTIFVPIPEDSGVNSVFVTVDDGTGVTVFTQNEIVVRHMSIGGTAMKAYSPYIWADWVPVTSNSSFIGITNRSAVEAFASITFGIDG